MLVIDASKCSGCRRCEVSCSFFHSGRIGQGNARIRVEKFEENGIDFPVVCQQCKERYCTKCPQNAISVAENGSITVSPTLCNLCGSCEKLCPIGAIEIYNDIPHVCDLCAGNPKCMEACSMDAISFAPLLRDTVSLDFFKQKTKKLSPYEKRYKWAQYNGKSIREAWEDNKNVWEVKK